MKKCEIEIQYTTYWPTDCKRTSGFDGLLFITNNQSLDISLEHFSTSIDKAYPNEKTDILTCEIEDNINLEDFILPQQIIINCYEDPLAINSLIIYVEDTDAIGVRERYEIASECLDFVFLE